MSADTEKKFSGGPKLLKMLLKRYRTLFSERSELVLGSSIIFTREIFLSIVHHHFIRVNSCKQYGDCRINFRKETIYVKRNFEWLLLSLWFEIMNFLEVNYFLCFTGYNGKNSKNVRHTAFHGIAFLMSSFQDENEGMDFLSWVLPIWNSLFV